MKRAIPVMIAVALLLSACASSGDAMPTTSSTAAIPDVAVTTTVPVATTSTASETAPTAEATSDEDKQAIADLYKVVFSSETGFDEKAPLIVDPSGLEDTVSKYMETGGSMGGVGLEAKEISVSGDVADVTYDLLFAGNPTYPNLKGDAVLVNGQWMVTRDMFCSIMTSARVGCP